MKSISYDYYGPINIDVVCVLSTDMFLSLSILFIFLNLPFIVSEIVIYRDGGTSKRVMIFFEMCIYLIF